jgi:hypothetical protein
LLLELQKQLPAAGAGDLILQLLEQAARVVAELEASLVLSMESMEQRTKVAVVAALEAQQQRQYLVQVDLVL